MSVPEEFDQLDPWATEDVTLVHVREGWRGDFFLLAGAYHTVFQRYQDVGTYCSVSHPWRIREPLRRHEPRSMFWLGFRHAHSFLRIRLQTTEVITPGETRADGQRTEWLDERRAVPRRHRDSGTAHRNAHRERSGHSSSGRSDDPVFCSWPGAFGPCQFE